MTSIEVMTPQDTNIYHKPEKGSPNNLTDPVPLKDSHNQITVTEADMMG